MSSTATVERLLDRAPTRAEAIALLASSGAEQAALLAAAAALRDAGKGRTGHLFPQGVHPAHQPLPRKLRLLHLRAPPRPTRAPAR